MNGPVKRRTVLARIGAAAVATSCGAPLSAQIKASVSDLERLLGRKVPEPLGALLPGEVLEGAAFIRSLMALEAEAKVLRLPPSILSHGDAALPLDADRLYELALPRAVALVDRSEFRNLPFAEKAGELLALLHRSQHVPPETFRGFAAVPSASGVLSLSDQDHGAAVIALPPVAGQVAADSIQPEIADLIVTRSVRFDQLAEEYAAHYHAAELRPDHQSSFDWHLAMMRKSKARYEGVAASTGVPWFFVGIVHAMEASFNFRAHLHNGDFPLAARTRQVPAGRPLRWLPPSDWESSAGDALRLMGFAGAQDWSLPRVLFRLEAFNGFGYRRMGKPSPYLWSFTSNYVSGKYVSDGRYAAKACSQQCGGAAMLKVLEAAGEVAFA
ncbi:MAG: hypothetical protein ACKOUT_16030 [Novosphingobium sp.]